MENESGSELDSLWFKELMVPAELIAEEDYRRLIKDELL